MKKLIFSLLVAGVALGASAFTNAQKVENFWFAVDPSDSQTILSPIDEPSGNCSLTIAEDRCAVELDTSTPPATVADAVIDGSYENSAYQDEN